MDHPDLPEVLAAVAEACGTGAALRLAGELGGTRVWVPKKIGPQSALARRVGVEIATALVEIYGGGDLLIPLGPTAWQARARAAVIRATEAGTSIAKTAQLAGVHERTVRRVRRRIRENEPLPLLDLMRDR